MIYGIMRIDNTRKVKVFIKFTKQVRVSTVDKLLGGGCEVTPINCVKLCLLNTFRDDIRYNNNLIGHPVEVGKWTYPYCANSTPQRVKKNKFCYCSSVKKYPKVDLMTSQVAEESSTEDESDHYDPVAAAKFADYLANLHKNDQ